MKALLIADEINLFHWSMLKSILLVLSLLPASQMLLGIWNATEGSSQIMVGFFMLSMMSSLLVLSFYSALQASVQNLHHEDASQFEISLVKIYRCLPMVSLAAMLSYLVTQI